MGYEVQPVPEVDTLPQPRSSVHRVNHVVPEGDWSEKRLVDYCNKAGGCMLDSDPDEAVDKGYMGETTVAARSKAPGMGCSHFEERTVIVPAGHDIGHRRCLPTDMTRESRSE